MCHSDGKGYAVNDGRRFVGSGKGLSLWQQRGDDLGLDVCLGEHRSTCLLQNLRASEFGAFAGVVGIEDTAASGLGILGYIDKVVGGVLQAILTGTEDGAVGVEIANGLVDAGY